jgi:hypothetical protein
LKVESGKIIVASMAKKGCGVNHKRPTVVEWFSLGDLDADRPIRSCPASATRAGCNVKSSRKKYQLRFNKLKFSRFRPIKFYKTQFQLNSKNAILI